MINEKESKPVLCPDGTYRWTYRLNMYKNPIILITVIKVLLISILIIAAIGFAINILDGSIDINLRNMEWQPILIATMVFFSIVIISYLIVAKQYGGQYYVLFEMDDEKITHRQMNSQFNKAQAIGWITAMAGIATANPTLTGLGINTATQNEMISYYKDVKKIIPKKYLGTIKINNRLQHNQVYVDKKDFEFVLNYLKKHCNNK